jgi:hypothetical protein
MTDEQLPDAEESTNIDPHLVFLVKLVNDFGIEISMTITVGGLLITGMLSSGQNYFRTFGEEFAAGFPGDSGATFRELYSQMAESKYPLRKAKTENEETDSTHIIYLHMRNSHILLANGTMIPTDGEGTWWRGKLEAVDGFFMHPIRAN